MPKNINILNDKSEIIQSLASQYEDGEIDHQELKEKIISNELNDSELKELIDSMPRENTAELLTELGQNDDLFGKIWDIYRKERRISEGKIESDDEFKEGEIFNEELADANQKMAA